MSMVAGSGAGKPLRVMVVDDDPVFGRVAVRLLTELGAEATAIARSFGLLNAMAEFRPALIVLDVMMPGLDGGTVAGLIRTDRELAGTRIVLCSAMDADALARKAAQCGVDGFVSKAAGLPGVRAEFARWLRALRDDA